MASILSSENLKQWKRSKSQFRCIVNADLLLRAYHCVSTETIRYYLNGVNVEPHPDGGALLEG